MSNIVWITALDHKPEEAQQLFETVKTYAKDVEGHFWRDNLEQMEWSMAVPELAKKGVGLWIIAGSAETFAKQSVRYGLSLLALSVQAEKGFSFPMLIVPTSGEVPVDSLPTPFRGAETVAINSPALGAKIAAKANIPISKKLGDYRLDIHPMPGIGQWFEVGPGKGHAWEKGVMFGVNGAEINAHGVGKAGLVPEKCTLEYPMQGLTIQSGGAEYTAWAVSNKLDEESSYYLRVMGNPESILFGPLPDEDEAEVFTLKLS